MVKQNTQQAEEADHQNDGPSAASTSGMIYAARAVSWCWENYDKSDFWKNISRVGGHLADYCRGELFGRSGSPPKGGWIVVHN